MFITNVINLLSLSNHRSPIFVQYVWNILVNSVSMSLHIITGSENYLGELAELILLLRAKGHDFCCVN